MYAFALLLAACTPETPAGGDSGVVEDGPATLAVGDIAEMTTADDGSVSVELTEAGKYIVILYSSAILQGQLYGYGDAAEAASRSTGERMARGGAAPSAPPAPPPAAPVVGDTRQFTVSDGSGNVTVDAVATAVTDGVIVWVDQTTANELGAIPEETITEVLTNFETIVMPRERQVFGEESDVDENGKINVLLSYTVNQYGAVAYVTGCDIGAANCSGNGGETIYMGIPDPEDSYATPNGITETFAHEINHLIYGWHKYAANDQAGADENIYLTEGMSALAQDLSGYNNGNQYVWAAAFDTSDYYDGDPNYSCDGLSVNDFLRGSGYYDDDRDGVLRGGAYLFLRYLFEQAGGFDVEGDGTLVDAGGMAFLQSWFDSPELGAETVSATTGRSVEDVSFDLYTAMVVSGRVENDNPAWNFQDRVEDPLTGYEFGVDAYDTIHGWMVLDGPLVQKLDRADGSLRSGGVEYLKVDVMAGELLTVPVSPDAKARARILRYE